MDKMKLIGSALAVMALTAGAVAYCHNTFAPKSIVENIHKTRAVVCMMAIESLDKKSAASYCGDIIKRKM